MCALLTIPDGAIAMYLHQPANLLRAAVVALAVCCLPQSAASPVGASQATKINGMTVSTPRGSSAWASDDMVATISELKELGVNWIAIHPYGRIDTDGTVSWSLPRRGRRGEPRSTTGGEGSAPAVPERAPDWLRRPIEEAHRQGMKILIKPHLAYWRDDEWRGDIRYENDEDWNRFFTT